MGLLTTIRDALGLAPPIVAAPPAPFAPTARAKKRLRALSGATIRVFTAPNEHGRDVNVQELTSAPPDELELPLMVSDADRAHLAGLELDHNGTAWTLHLPFDVRGHETPNPDVRLYETSRVLIEGRPLHVDASTPTPGLPAVLLALPHVVSLLLRDNAVSVERAPAASWAVMDRDVEAALRHHFRHCGQALTQAQLGRSEDPTWTAVSDVMSRDVLPYVHKHGGDIQLIDVVDGVVTVSLHGACASCPASMLTLKGGVQRQLREALPDLVERVEAVTG